MRIKINVLQKISSLALLIAATFTTNTNESTLDKESLNIVISSNYGGRSHIKYVMDICRILRDRGHTITYAAPESNHWFNDPYGYKIYNIGKSTLDSKEAYYNTDADDIIKMGISFMPKFLKNILVNHYNDYFLNYEKLFTTGKKVDLVICDFFAGPCHDGARKHNIPLIVGFQGLSLNIASAPYITNSMDSSPTTTENFGFIERFKKAVVDPLHFLYHLLPLSVAVNEVREKYGIQKHDNPWGAFDKVMKISNTFIGFDDARPIPPSVKLVGPVIDADIPPLDSELQSFLDSYRTLYIAFGANAALNTRLLTALLQAAQMSIDSGVIDGVLWGLANSNPKLFPKTIQVNDITYSTSDILNGKHPKIKILNWAPQKSILNHPNTKLFLSHGGVDSIFECISAAKPMLVMPIFGDQPRNSRIVKNRGIGDLINTATTDSNDIASKIKELLRPDNVELVANIKHIREMTKFNNGKRLESALFIEHYANMARICRATQKPKQFEIPCELKPYMSADSRMGYFAAYKIDILLTLAGIGFILISVLLIGAFKVVRRALSISISNKIKNE
ncbi:glycosyltransferase family 1 protein [Conidiobolus coronatus NRRL 28638]|uniref:Glycosyltransferase family 1 protein n=1 Tax=Conidiobolus coronatus (strain ATCC 28846 / CBS 209.66 / NRRL 28638) TaxID=796925 RepID=A0A137NYN2_CONC2|nr:glycosyltransferase family 1 protein [Conidiobolus coronatus NRRL 28638]|eukprot:KXN67771.1 glycosyltransferase family 1 protein [Conidiobolus coronatus NRRL 28638]